MPNITTNHAITYTNWCCKTLPICVFLKKKQNKTKRLRKKKKSHPAGVEPKTFNAQGQRIIHCATQPLLVVQINCAHEINCSRWCRKCTPRMKWVLQKVTLEYHSIMCCVLLTWNAIKSVCVSRSFNYHETKQAAWMCNIPRSLSRWWEETSGINV